MADLLKITASLGISERHLRVRNTENEDDFRTNLFSCQEMYFFTSTNIASVYSYRRWYYRQGDNAYGGCIYQNKRKEESVPFVNICGGDMFRLPSWEHREAGAESSEGDWTRCAMDTLFAEDDSRGYETSRGWSWAKPLSNSHRASKWRKCLNELKTKESVDVSEETDPAYEFLN